jgi:SAM-dependent MidA family methyltransferase
VQSGAKSKWRNASGSEADAGAAALREEVLATIRRDGPVTFAAWMERALYHPEHGYYSSGRAQIGRAGDYFTNVSVGPLFGRLMAAQFREMWEVMGRPEEFTVVEQGAHSGEFARDVLEAARDWEQLRYCICEPFPVLEARQRETLAEFTTKTRWCSAPAGLGGFVGVHFSNELFDALPVHVVRWTGAEWLERYVGERDGEFQWVDLALSSERLTERVAAIPHPLPDGYVTEVNLAALDVIADIAQQLTRGFVVVVDYGFARDEFYAPHRSSGTLRSYSGHRVFDSPLELMGAADITTHVEWTSVIEQAQSCGLQVAGFADQHHFITGLLAAGLVPPNEATSGRALQTLLHPAQLGMKFQYLVLTKGVSSKPQLAGLQFARC